MAYTDNCDFYAAVSETGVNRIAKHIMVQRPSRFNFATQYVSDHPELACHAVAHTIDVTHYNNPLFKVVNAFPILIVDSPPFGLNFCVQMVEAKADFYPGNIITLPPALHPPLAKQHLAVQARICGGLDCPSEFLQSFLPTPNKPRDNGQQPPEIVPPTRKLLCFCVDAYMVAHVECRTIAGKLTLVGIVDGVDVTFIEPTGLSENINCYLRTTLQLLLKEKALLPLSTMIFELPLLDLATITATLTPNPPVVHNPAIEDDQLKVFINIEVAP